MTAKFNELVEKLKEIFQIDKPELDFGVYRILHARSKEINDFLTKRLAEKVQQALAGNAAAEQGALKAELDQAIENAKALGVPDPDAIPKVKELKAKLAAAGGGSDQAESEVYSHLLTFFSRYYDDGDFISKRRYKGDTYAIPYAGEEVKLHWANADQYYVKSGENFTNYDFTIDGGAKVHFKLITAETAKDNIKDNESDRRFVLFEPESVVSEEGIVNSEEAEREPRPTEIVEEKDGELYIYFQYLKVKKGTKQKDLIAKAEEKVMALVPKFQKFIALAGKAPTEKDKNRTLFRKHLEQYTAKNTSDYFIHKDLKGFLTRELDFYIKNEMMHLDDIQNATAFKQIEMNLREIQAVRTIAAELIDFMAQIEDFQKKLWLKKKFVTRCDYCITMDRVPEALHAEIFANIEQQEEWKRLGLPTGKLVDAKSSSRQKQGELDLGDSAAPVIDGRMVDTKFFDEGFKAKILASIPDLDGQCDGVLVHGENLGALSLLRACYESKVHIAYLDPPYNTGNDGFLYRDGYGHSSWLSMLFDRLRAVYELVAKDGLVLNSIADHELKNLGFMYEYIFGEKNFLANFIWNNEGNIDNQSKVKINHEYILSYCKNEPSYSSPIVIAPDIDATSKLFNDTIENSITKNGPANPVSIVTLPAGFPASVDSCDVNARNDAWPHLLDNVVVRNGVLKNPVRAESGWSSRALLDAYIENGCNDIVDGKGLVTRFKITNTGAIYCYKDRKDSSHVLSVIRNVGTVKKMSGILGDMGFEFSYPKPIGLLEYLCKFSNHGDAVVLDCFAGSGTTGNAVINLRRQELGVSHRKYILVEMGDHFDTVLKPRIEKVVYSPDWKDGKPLSSDKGISHCFKYLTLESYEDALNNIELEDKSGLFEGALKDEYLLKYMLDLESRGSVINTDNFRKPFDYELKIAVDSSGASEKRKIDLVETFNYLIGMTVLGMDRHVDKGYVLVTGTLPGEDKESLIVWRDCDKIDNEALNKLLATKGVKPGDSEFKTIFVNGDHAVPNKKLGAEDGAGELKIRQIENVFLEKMFEEK